MSSKDRQPPWHLDSICLKVYGTSDIFDAAGNIVAIIPTTYPSLKNAKLMAAAPEILAALKAMLRNGGNAETIKDAKKAINKTK